MLAYMCGGTNPGSCPGIDAGTWTTPGWLSAVEMPPTRDASNVSCVESVGEFPPWPFPRAIGRGMDVPRWGMDEAILSRRLRVRRRRMGRVGGERFDGSGGRVGGWDERVERERVLSVVGCDIHVDG